MADVPGATVVVEDKADDKKASTLPFYTFEVYLPEQGGKSDSLASAADMNGVEPRVTLRIPPQNMQISSAIRSDISIDLLGGITVAEGGMGLRRWTISGAHGVGMDRLTMLKASGGHVTMAKGYAVRQALATFFETWAIVNETRRKEQEPLLRMLFSVRGGTLTEFQNEEWWIQPDGLPEESRSASRPLDWAWSLSFVALRRFKDELATSQGAETLMPDTLWKVQEKVDESVKAVDKVIAKAQKSRLQDLLKKAKSIKAQLQSIRDKVSASVSLYRNTVSEVAGYIKTCSNLVSETMLMVNRSNLYDQPAREMFNSLRDVQTALGYAKMAADGYLQPFNASAVSPTAVNVQPGDTLQSIAALQLGDASRWTELAALNGLTYPYLDFSGAGGAPDSIFTAAEGAKVLGLGDELKLPNTEGDVAPADPIGTDMDDGGDIGILVGGVENLRAALLRRLRTPRGYLPHHPEYGSDLSTYVGRELTPALVLSARAEVERTLKEDPRVISVQSVGVSVDTDSITLQASATTALGPISLSGTVGGLSTV